MAWARLAIGIFLLTTAAVPGLGKSTLEARYPWLRDRSSFSLSRDLERSSAGSRDAAFPMGNGEVFAIAGPPLAPGALGSLRDLRTRPGHDVGASTLDVTIDGKVLPLRRWKIRPVRRSAILETTLVFPGCRLHTIDAAPPGLPGVFRLVSLKNTGKTPLTGASLRITFEPTGDLPTSVQLLGYGLDETLEARAPGETSPTRFDLSIPTIDPGKEQYAAVFVLVGDDPERDRAVVTDRFTRFGPDLLLHTRSWWSAWFSDKIEISGDDPRVGDFLERQLVHLATQRIGRKGPFASLLDYRGIRPIEQWGPVRGLLATGDVDSSRGAVDSLHRAARATGELRAHYPVSSLVADPATEPPSGFPWSDEMDGETALVTLILNDRVYPDVSFSPVLIQKWDYLLANLTPFVAETGGPRSDCPSLVEATPETLSRLLRESPEIAARFVAHGEDRHPVRLEQRLIEAAAWNAMDRLWEHRDLPGAPPHPFSRRGDRLRRTLDRDFLHRKGFHAPARSPLTGEKHPVPSARAGLAPLWMNTISGTNPVALDTLESLLSFLVDEFATGERLVVRAVPGHDRIEGATLGKLLYSLGSTRHPLTDDALAAILAAASDSGGLADEYDAATLTPTPGATRLDVQATGIVLEAIVHALAGPRVVRDAADFSPHVPRGWSEIRFANLPVEGLRLGLHVERKPDRFLYHVHLGSGQPIPLGLGIHVPAKGEPELTCMGRDASRLVQFQSGVYSGRTTRLVLEDDLRPNQTLEIVVTFEPQSEPDPTEYVRNREPLSWTGVPNPRTITLVLAAREGDRRHATGLRARLLDVGLPMTPEHLATHFYDSATKKARCERLVFPPGITEPGPTTLKTRAFWEDPALRKALEDFEKAGGVIVRAQ